jgi:hypothetical protein
MALKHIIVSVSLLDKDKEKKEIECGIRWAHGDSNAGPHGYQPCAPPGYAMGPQ